MDKPRFGRGPNFCLIRVRDRQDKVEFFESPKGAPEVTFGPPRERKPSPLPSGLVTEETLAPRFLFGFDLLHALGFAQVLVGRLVSCCLLPGAVFVLRGLPQPRVLLAEPPVHQNGQSPCCQRP